MFSKRGIVALVMLRMVLPLLGMLVFFFCSVVWVDVVMLVFCHYKKEGGTWAVGQAAADMPVCCRLLCELLCAAGECLDAGVLPCWEGRWHLGCTIRLHQTCLSLLWVDVFMLVFCQFKRKGCAWVLGQPVSRMPVSCQLLCQFCYVLMMLVFCHFKKKGDTWVLGQPVLCQLLGQLLCAVGSCPYAGDLPFRYGLRWHLGRWSGCCRQACLSLASCCVSCYVLWVDVLMQVFCRVGEGGGARAVGQPVSDMPVHPPAHTHTPARSLPPQPGCCACPGPDTHSSLPAGFPPTAMFHCHAASCFWVGVPVIHALLGFSAVQDCLSLHVEMVLASDVHAPGHTSCQLVSCIARGAGVPVSIGLACL